MRIVIVWLWAFTMLFMVSVGWWVSQPVVIGVANGIRSQNTTPQGQNIALGVEYVSYVWGPLFDIFILLWAILNSQQKDITSEVYR